MLVYKCSKVCVYVCVCARMLEMRGRQWTIQLDNSRSKATRDTDFTRGYTVQPIQNPKDLGANVSGRGGRLTKGCLGQ